MTLVELLVVLGIIGLLASISIPLAISMGPTPTRTVETAAREMFTLLKSARIYATTFNVETVVSYALATPVDTLTLVPCPILDSVALGRRMTSEERARAEVYEVLWLREGIPISTPVYVRVQNDYGQFTRMRGGTCIVSPECFAAGLWGGRYWEGEGQPGYLNQRGMVPVILFDLDSLEFVRPRNYDVNTLELGADLLYADLTQKFLYSFPAHVFLPSGGMFNRSSRERAKIRMGLLPSASANDRQTIAYNPETGEPLIDPNTGAPQETPLTVDLTLYRAQGRIKVGS